MAVATSINPAGSPLVTIHQFDDEPGSATPFTRNILVPAWADYVMFFLNWTVEGGTTGLIDFVLNAVDPINKETVTPLASWNGITQLAAVDLITVTVGPGVTGITDDDTAVDYYLNTSLPPIIQSVLTLDVTDTDEVYDLTLSAYFRGK